MLIFMRIISGKFKGRKISGLVSKLTRPTTVKVRGAVFNILSSILSSQSKSFSDVVMLDLCCGTGSMGLEGISRGVKHVTFIDSEFSCIDSIKRITSDFGLNDDDCTFYISDAMNMPYMRLKYDFIYIDPPYHQNILDRIIESLMRSKCLIDGSIVILEHEKDKNITFSTEFYHIDKKVYGNLALSIFEYSGVSIEPSHTDK